MITTEMSCKWNEFVGFLVPMFSVFSFRGHQEYCGAWINCKVCVGGGVSETLTYMKLFITKYNCVCWWDPRAEHFWPHSRLSVWHLSCGGEGAGGVWTGSFWAPVPSTHPLVSQQLSMLTFAAVHSWCQTVDCKLLWKPSTDITLAFLKSTRKRSLQLTAIESGLPVDTICSINIYEASLLRMNWKLDLSICLVCDFT